MNPQSELVTRFLKSKFLIVVDDDAMVRSVVIEFLEKFGFKNIIAFKSGNSAMSYIQNSKNRVDLVISDWEMPGLDGLGLLKAIRGNANRSQVKFLMLTSQISRERMKIARAKLWEVDAYIVKPFRGELLKEKIFNLFGLLGNGTTGSEKAG